MTELIERLLHEDVPYGDLTSRLLELPPTPARMRVIARDPVVLAGGEVAAAIGERVGATLLRCAAEGEAIPAGGVLLELDGPAPALHRAWKVMASVLEGCCGIAGRTRAVVNAAAAGNPAVQVFTTRKSFPGTKELAISAVLAGGAFPHRLGLSETVLVFAQHIAFIGGLPGLLERLPQLRRRACEKLVLVEVERPADALAVARAGVGGIQFDKLGVDDLAAVVPHLRAIDPAVRLIAAGGITAANASSYAATGVDALATSWVFAAPPADLKVVIEPR